jgi:hypothetical protein
MWIEVRNSQSVKKAIVLSLSMKINIDLELYVFPFYKIPHLPQGTFLNSIMSFSNIFENKISQYNSTMAFTSIGVNIRTTIIGTLGSYSFQIHRGAHHKMRPMLPPYEKKLCNFTSMIPSMNCKN